MSSTSGSSMVTQIHVDDPIYRGMDDLKLPRRFTPLHDWMVQPPLPPAPDSTDTIQDLAANGIIVHKEDNEGIPARLKVFLDMNLGRWRQKDWSDEYVENITEVLHFAQMNPRIDQVKPFLDVGCIPIAHPEVCSGGDSEIASEIFPQRRRPAPELSHPRPWRHWGYRPNPWLWDVKNAHLLGHEYIRQRILPNAEASHVSLPFFFITREKEGASEVALIESAKTGASCVNSMKWLLRAVDPMGREVSMIKTLAFSATISPTGIAWYVHWFDRKTGSGKFHTSRFTTYGLDSDLWECRKTALNMMDFCMGVRLQRVQDAVTELGNHPFFTQYLSDDCASERVRWSSVVAEQAVLSGANADNESTTDDWSDLEGSMTVETEIDE